MNLSLIIVTLWSNLGLVYNNGCVNAFQFTSVPANRKSTISFSSNLFVSSNRSRPRDSSSRSSSSQRKKKPYTKPSWDLETEVDSFVNNDNSKNGEDFLWTLTQSQTIQNRKEEPIQCIHFDTCPGCVVNDKTTDIPIVKSAQLFFSSPSIQRHTLSNSNDDLFQVVIPSPVIQWRTQAKLAVAPKSKWGRDGCEFGLYQRGTHQVFSIPECRVHHPNINRAVELLTQATVTVRTDAFEEMTGSGSLRYVQLQVERMTGKVCLTLVWNAELLKHCQPGLSRLMKELKRLDPGLWHSIWCHCNNGLGNNIFARGDSRWHLMDGPEFVREPLPPIQYNDDHEKEQSNQPRKDGLLFFNPMSFRQGNMDGFETIAEHVAKSVPPDSAVCELYAGVGMLGLTALSYAHNNHNAKLRWLRCSDENPANPKCFKRALDTMPTEVTGRPIKFRDMKNKKGRNYNNNKRRNVRNSSQKSNEEFKGNSKGDKVTYMVASAAKALLSGQALGANVLIVDPPRKGLDDEVVSQLCKPINPNQAPIEDIRMLFAPIHTCNLVNDVTTLIYVSCGFDSFTRDTDAILSSSAGWKLVSATGYLLFPGTNHLETVAVFKRDGGEDLYDENWD